MAAVVGIGLLLSGCTITDWLTPSETTSTVGQEPIHLLQMEEPAEGQETAQIQTGQGTITIVLYPEQAPQTVRQFKRLVNEGYYNGKPIFLQSDIPALISGASDETGEEGKVATEDGKPVEVEKSESLWHFSGAVSVLPKETGIFSTTYVSDSRFFILGNIPPTDEIAAEMKEYEYPDSVIGAYQKRGGLPQYTGRYTVFGQVIDGMDVLERILKTEIDAATGHPSDATKIESITLSTYHSGDPVDFIFEESVASNLSESLSENSSDAESAGEE